MVASMVAYSSVLILDVLGTSRFEANPDMGAIEKSIKAEAEPPQPVLDLIEAYTNLTDRNLVEAIIVMCHKLGMQVVAEGVETLVQRNMLATMGCDLMQGYLFGRPEAAEHLFGTHGRGIPGEASLRA